MKRSAYALASLLMLSAVTTPAHAQSVADFYRGKQIRVIVGTAPGDYDAWVRLVSRHMRQYVPGNPSFVVENMPGAGSLIAANWLANVAPKDGTGIAIIPSATLFENLLGNASARFDARRLNWLISLNDYTAIAMAWHETPFITAADMLTRELLVGSNAPASDTTVWPQLLNALIGTKVRMVKGYPGTTGIALAMERGEVQGMIGDDWASVKANKADWLREKKVRILMQMTAARHADLPDVPVVGEFAKDQDKRRVLELFVLRQ